MDLRNEDLVNIYRVMLQGRIFEDTVTRLAMEGKLPSHHSGVGHEAIGAGVGFALTPADAVMPSHRSGITLSFMVGRNNVRDAIFGQYGKSTGRRTGNEKPMPRFLRGVGLIGSQIPMAVGAAMADKLKGNDSVTICFLGDGGANRGDFHEGVNLASARKLPIVFIIENNGYAISMSAQEATGIVDFADRAQGYGMPGVVVDGNDAMAVHEVVSQTLARARQGLGPSLVECKVFRWYGHVSSDPDTYRSDEYREEMKSKCPIEKLAKEMVNRGVLSAEQAQSIRQEVEREVADAIEAAQAAPRPESTVKITPEMVKSWVYAD